MAHPNADLAREIKSVVNTDNETNARNGLRKGFLLASPSGYVLTPKGADFVAKWGNRG